MSNAEPICPKCGKQERENWDPVHDILYLHSPASGLCFDCCALVAEQVRVIINDSPWILDNEEWMRFPGEPPDEAA
jgi:hypothetical protein